MRINILVVSTVLCVLAAQTGYADNKLFPTDVLDKNEFDAQIDIGHQSQSRYVTSTANIGSQRTDITTESLGVRYGLGDHWQITGDIPFRSENITKTDYSSPIAHFSDSSKRGSQNPILGMKYGIIDEPDSAWSLSGKLSVSPNITNKDGTAYDVTLSAGWKASDSLKYYAELNGKLIDRDTSPDSVGIALGAYKDIYENVTLIPHAGFTEFQSTSTFSSLSQFDIGLASEIQVSKNTYLLPNATYFSNDSGDAKNVSFHASSSNGRAFSIGLYHLF